MKLYSYWRSSAAYRVRIALQLKGIETDYVPVNLLQSEHKCADYLARNPAGLVPTLELDDGRCLTQSLAIIDYLDSAIRRPRCCLRNPWKGPEFSPWPTPWPAKFTRSTIWVCSTISRPNTTPTRTA